MKNIIIANLNLNQSIEEFKKSIEEILRFKNVKKWNGITIKDFEEQIRTAGLILAGQCIAILLHQLSQLEEAKKTGENQTAGWWRKKTKKNGSKTWQILTLGNVLVKLKLPYVVERKRLKESKRKSRNQGFCPWLRWLGMAGMGASI